MRQSNLVLATVFQVYKHLCIFSANLWLYLQKVWSLIFYTVSTDHARTKYNTPNGNAPISPNNAQASSRSSELISTATDGIRSRLFAEKLIPVLVDLFLRAPAVEKCIIFPEIVQSLGRYHCNHGVYSIINFWEGMKIHAILVE